MELLIPQTGVMESLLLISEVMLVLIYPVQVVLLKILFNLEAMLIQADGIMPHSHLKVNQPAIFM